MALKVAKARDKPDTTLPRSARLAGHLSVVCMYADRLIEAPTSEVLRDSLRLAVERARADLHPGEGER